MKILHTSDWHIGRVLHARKRYDEFEAFFKWLFETIEAQKVDALLIAGDVFDTSMTTNRAQQLYYRFLCRVAGSCCRHVVVVGGNHDSSSFLDAPKELLKGLNVHVVGAASGCPADEVVVLRGVAGNVEAIVCAVPYLRDRDIRTVEAGEDVREKSRKLLDGITKHYVEVCKVAESMRKEAGNVPLIAMGHLFAAGGKTIEDDGVRELYVGTLAQTGAEAFPPCIDYLALGHLHISQVVAGNEKMRYCGSPLPMGFGEAEHEKKVLLVDFVGNAPQIVEHSIPCFQRLKRISGTLPELLDQISHLKQSGGSVWLEVKLTETAPPIKVKESLESAIAGSKIEIMAIKNMQLVAGLGVPLDIGETINDLSVEEVFNRCLDARAVPAAQRQELLQTYRVALASLHEKDVNLE